MCQPTLTLAGIGALVLMGGDILLFTATLTYLISSFFFLSKKKTFVCLGIGSAILFFLFGMLSDLMHANQFYILSWLAIALYFLLPFIVLGGYIYSNRGKHKCPFALTFLTLMSALSCMVMVFAVPPLVSLYWNIQGY